MSKLTANFGIIFGWTVPLTFRRMFFFSCLSSCSLCLCVHCFLLILLKRKFLNRFLHWVLCNCSASEGQMLMLYLSIFCMKIKTNSVLVSKCHRSVFFWFFGVSCGSFPHGPILTYGRYFSVSCQISLQNYSIDAFEPEMLTTPPKNISEDFIDFWFNCVPF